MLFLDLAWPPGARVNPWRAGRALRTYVRDPDAALARYAPTPFTVGVTPPVGTIATGFVRRGNTLAVDPTGDVYVTRPDGSVERWPRVDPAPGCD